MEITANEKQLLLQLQPLIKKLLKVEAVKEKKKTVHQKIEDYKKWIK